MTPTDFLKTWCGETGPFSVGAIDPDDTSKDGHAWLTTRDLAEVEHFVKTQADLKRNIYLQINVCRPNIGSLRAQRAHIVAAQCVHVEIDPPDGVDSPESLQNWQAEQFEHLTSDAYWRSLQIPKPTGVIFSGTGYVALWRLPEQLVLWRGEPLEQDPHLIEAIESRNRWLIENLGGDPQSVDVSRLLRLPGTLNWPNASKRAKGRTEPVLAEVIELDMEHTVSLGLMPASARDVRTSTGPVELPKFEGAPADEQLLEAAELLGKSWAPPGQRHDAHLALAGALAKAGWPEELIASFAEAVAEEAEPGSGQYDRRLKFAQQSVAKAKAGVAIKGWPSLIPHVGEDVVRDVRRLLGFPDYIEDDPDFTAALEQASPFEKLDDTVTYEMVVSDVRAMKNKLARRSDPDDVWTAKVLGKVLASTPLASDGEETPKQALCRAALTVVRAVRKGTSPEQIVSLLHGSASIDGLAQELPSIVDGALEFAARKQKAELPPEEFRLDDDGVPIAKNQHNIRVALRKCDVTFKYNLFAEREIVCLPDGSEETVEDHHIKTLRNRFEREFNFCPEKDFLFDTCEVIARENAFHPVREYLESCPPDVPLTDICETWLIRFAGAPDTPYVRAVSRIVLVAAVRRIRQPGCKFDEMLILETPEQGKNKSTALRMLVPNEEWFTDDFSLHADDSRRMIETMVGHWIIEAAELKDMARAGSDALKSFLSRREDKARMAYARKTTTRKRQCIIIGTVNEREYLKDPTGNRRFWPVRIQQFDVGALVAARDQIWAEAARLDREHPEEEYIRLDPSLYAAAAAEQSERQIADPYIERLENAGLDQVVGAIQFNDIARLFGHEERVPSAAEQARIVAALHTLGWSKKRLRFGGKQGTYYIRGDESRRVLFKLNGSGMTGWQLKPVTEGHEAVVPEQHSSESQTPTTN